MGLKQDSSFELTLDTLAPLGSITRPSEAIKEQSNCTIVTGGAIYMYVWTDLIASPTVIPLGLEPVAASNSYTTECNNGDGTYYAHLVLMDDVNNKSEIYNTSGMIFDTHAPEVLSLTIADGADITQTRNIKIEFSFEDNLSGVYTYILDGDITEDSKIVIPITAEERSKGRAERNITLSGEGAEEATKTVKVSVVDEAGNVSSIMSDSIKLDTKFLVGDLVLNTIDDERTITGLWYNSEDVLVKLILSDDTKEDLAAYRIYGEGLLNPDSEWTEVLEADNVAVAKKFTSGDSSTKIVRAEVKDKAGNITILGTNHGTEEEPNIYEFASLDYSPPTVSISVEAGATLFVSKLTGFTTKNLVPTVDATISGIASYSWNINNEPYPNGLGTTTPTTFTVDSKEMGEGGENVPVEFTLTITDNAGNSSTSSPLIIYLDTVAPTGSIEMPAWLNGDNAETTTYPHLSTAGATASATDGGSGVEYMQCWCSSVADDTNVAGTRLTYQENPPHSSIAWGGMIESDSNYIHIKYTDSVGNSAIIHSSSFGIDTVRPDNGAVHFNAVSYSSPTATVTFTASDVTSGIDQFKIWGDIKGGPTSELTATWQKYASPYSLTLTDGDGRKYIYVKYKDVAGNVSADMVSDETYLDTSKPTGTITLWDADESKLVDSERNIADFVAHIAYTDSTALEEYTLYKIYGDFNFNLQQSLGITEEDAVWTDFVYDTDKQYKKIDNMYCTTNQTDEPTVKTVYLRVKDAAGNISDVVSATFTYDTTIPGVTISNVDFNRISKVHAFRRDASGESTKYADEMHFTFTPDSKMSAYKVCAYLSLEDALKGTHEDEAIPTTGGSVNMSATGLDSNTPVDSMIRGVDFENALGGAGHDGAHIVVVYVRDKGGNWSKATEEVAF